MKAILQNAEEIGRNIVGRALTDAEAKQASSLTGMSGPFYVAVFALGDGKASEKGVTLATTGGRIGARLRVGGKIVHAPLRMSYFEQYQDDRPQQGSGNTPQGVNIF